MRDYNLNAFLNLTGVPGLAFRSVYARTEHRVTIALICQNSLQPRNHIVLLRVYREYLTTPSLGQLFPDLFDQLSFFRIQLILWKITRVGDDKPDIAANFRIELRAIQYSQ